MPKTHMSVTVTHSVSLIDFRPAYTVRILDRGPFRAM